MYYFSTRDLVLIAATSAAGGVLSSYVGYLGNLMNRLFGVPFGAGQFMAGLHVFWFVLARAIIGRTGAGTLTGLLKGLVEFFAGSTHGAVVVLVSVFEGIIVDLVLLPYRRPSRPPAAAMGLAGGLASASNVLVFQGLFFSGVSLGYIALMLAFAFMSGAVFGGVFTAGVLEAAAVAGLLKIPGDGGHRAQTRKPRSAALLLFSAVLALTLAGGAVYYFTSVKVSFADGPAVAVQGNIERPYEYREESFSREVITVRAELVGQVTYVPPADYSGVPMGRILEYARPKASAARLRAIGSDGYEAIFDLSAAMDQPDLIVHFDGEDYRIVAPGWDGAFWVRKLARLVVD